MCGKDPRPCQAGLVGAGLVRRGARERDSGWRPNRRDLLKAGATFGALAAGGGIAQGGHRPGVALAQDEVAADAPETLAGTWVEAEQLSAFRVAEAGAANVVPADFPFYAVGAHWAGEVGTWPTIELSFSWDGATFTEPVSVNA